MFEMNIRVEPKIMKFLLPNRPKYLPTMGLTMAKDTEYTQNRIPTKDWSTPFDSASAGRNGAITLYAALRSMLNTHKITISFVHDFLIYLGVSSPSSPEIVGS